MTKKPRNPHQKILNRHFTLRLVYVGTLMGLMVIGLYIWTLYRYGWTWSDGILVQEMAYMKATSIAFVFLTTLQMAHTFNARSETQSIFKIPFFSNPKLIGAVVLSLLLTVLIVEVPFFQKYVHTTHLSALEWIMIIGASFTIIVLEETRKWMTRRHLPLSH